MVQSGQEIKRGGVQIGIAVDDQPIFRRERFQEVRQGFLKNPFEELDPRVVDIRRPPSGLPSSPRNNLIKELPIFRKSLKRVKAEETRFGMAIQRRPGLWWRLLDRRRIPGSQSGRCRRFRC